MWIVIIFIYYFFATILPIDVIIGRLYPLFAVVLIIMAVGVAGGLIWNGYEFYQWAEWTNQHPQGLPIWPLLFVTIACGALSGFHATQSPLMSRCLVNERDGRAVFYGAMIAEGIIALIWATAGMTFYESPQALLDAGALTNTGAGLTFIDFSIIWRYFGWSNQTLATIVLWTSAAYLVKRGACHWIATVPATIMTAIVVTYIRMEKIGFNLPYTISLYIGYAAAVGSRIAFLMSKNWFTKNVKLDLPYQTPDCPIETELEGPH